MSKRKKDILISFVGNNASDVAGSMILIETQNIKILLECGIVQNAGNPLDDFKINNQAFPFKAKDLDYIFLNHSHADHSALIPKLIHDGFTGKIITSEITAKLLKPMFLVSCKIIKNDAKILSKNRKKEVYPFYNEEDVYNSLNLVYEYEYNKVYKLDKDVSFKFLHNSHIIGALQLELYINNNLGVQQTILYTSDLGSFKVKNHYVSNNDKCTKASIVISECTYGKRTQESAPNREKDLEKIKTIIQETCIDRSGRVLIPVFSLARSQEILTNLYEIYKNDNSFKIPIYVNSPLILEINKIYSKYLDDKGKELFEQVCNWKNVHFISSLEESKYNIKDKSPKIVLSSSGFLIKGRSCEYLKEYITNKNDTIVSVGYAPEHSTFGKIKNNEPLIKIDGKNYKNNCKCMTLNSFSSHIPRHELLSYLKSIYTDKYYLVHGEIEGKLEFKEDLENELSKMCRSSTVISTTKNTICYL